ncbi:hypothetical protein WJX72_000379 [[Myrmecia] bisecta]|uniref:Uncharacterized protein n=1 Tax=[Myrmecia] bisecta TaxID=41462 RepID=A0AAW1R5E3_9CHLO
MNKGSLRDSAPAQPSGSAAIPGPAAELIGAHRGPPSQQRGALQSEAHEASVGQTTAVRSTAGASAIQHRMQTGSEAAASTAKGGTVRQPALHGLPNGYNAPGRLSEPDSHPGTRGAVNGPGTTPTGSLGPSASYVHAPGNSSSGAKEPQRLEKGTSSRPLAAPRALQPPKLVPLTDLERLLAAITPTLDVGPLKGNAMRLCLADVWGCFHEASLYAREVYTLSGARGPAISYYVPFLSAMQLFLPAGPPPSQATSAQPPGGVPHRLYQSDSEWGGWGRSLRPLAELFATELPFNRVPLYDKVLQLAKGPCADGLPGRLLLDARLCDLHPASWFSVAWYPVYRIPDAPLNARFLTFHSLSPVPAAAGPGNASAHTRLLALPPVGLKWCNLQGERWLEPLAPQRPSEGTAPERPADSRASSREASPESAAAPASLSSNGGSGGPAVAGDPGRGQARGRESPDQSGNGTAPPAAAAVAAKHNPGSAEAAALLSASLAGHPVVAVAADGQQADPMAAAAAVARQARFSELQATAERLARGTGLQVLGDKGFEDAKLRHPDFEFFHSRG